MPPDHSSTSTPAVAGTGGGPSGQPTPELQEYSLAREILTRRAIQYEELLSLLRQPDVVNEIDASARSIANSLSRGGKVFFCGNGGSAADAQHLVAEFVGRFRGERRPLAAIALGANQAVASALANDYGYGDGGLARELEALASPGDVLVAITTSGRSPNIHSTISCARELGVDSIALTGRGHQLGGSCQSLIVVESDNIALIQEMHGMIGHVICEMVEDRLGLS